MNEKNFIKERSNNTFRTIALILIVSVISSSFTYVLLGKNNIVSKNGNVTYEIKEVSSPVVAIAEKTGPSIVGIKVKAMTQSMFGLLTDSGSEGSGIIYSNDGYIITNYHVIETAINNSSSAITVFLPNNDEEIKATIVGGDKVTDLAVIKIESKDLKNATFGKSSDVVVGDLAVAIGNPLGQEFAGSVTSGIISAVNRKITTEGKTFNLIQTDAAINPGNSGGALVNNKGEVIGINTIKIGETGVEGLGFAIPIDEAKPIIEQLIKDKKIVRPYIGITGMNIDKTTVEKYQQFELVEGVYITDILKNSPADIASIEKGDIITKIDGTEIKTIEGLNEYKNKKNVGDKVTLKVYRQKKYIDIEITLAEDNS
jgi:serine protease Do